MGVEGWLLGLGIALTGGALWWLFRAGYSTQVRDAPGTRCPNAGLDGSTPAKPIAPPGEGFPRLQPIETVTMPALAELMPSLAKVKSRAEPSTERQQAAIRAIGFVGDPSGLTLGQASALISAKVYAEGAMYVLIKQTDGYPHEQLAEANLAAFIVKDDKLRARAMEWNERRYARGHRGTPKPKRDEHLERVMDEADRLYKILLPYDV